ncbi:DUF3137 domain-containing protein [Alishewanella longhuensis]
MTDMQHNGENIASPYKKSKTANLFSIAIEIVATAVKKFFRHTLLRRPKPDRDSALYRTTVQKLQQHYADRLTELETQRQKVARQSRPVRRFVLPTIAVITGLSTLLALALTIMHFLLTLEIDVQLLGMLLPVYFWAVMIACVIIVKTYAVAYDNYNVCYRTLFIPALAESFDQITYQRYGYIELAKLKNSLILPGHDLIYQEDYFSGTHNGCAFEVVEAELYKRDHGRQRDNKSFSGLILSIALPHSFNSTTLVRKNSFLLNLQRKTSMRFKRVHLEDNLFRRNFRVHSNDQIAARSWLTPAVMQRLLQLAKVFNCIDFQASLYQDKLLVLISTAQDFLPPPPIDIPLTDSAAGYEFVTELSAMYQLIDALLAQFSTISKQQKVS